MEKILILGASGLVGRALCKELRYEYKVYGTYNHNGVSIDNVDMIKFDIDNLIGISEILDKYKPNKIIISLRGDNKTQLQIINEVIKYSKETDSNIYFISTWNVFDANPNKIYYENDERISDTGYGTFKIEAENLLLREIKDRCTIFRLPMIWGKNSPRLNKLITNIENNEPVEIVTNLYLNHNNDEILASQIKYIIENYSNGIYHMGSVDEINHVDFIKTIVDKLGYKDVEFNEVQYGEGRYIATLGTNNILPKEIQTTNEKIIDNLTK